jgi:hypothetical protein
MDDMEMAGRWPDSVRLSLQLIRNPQSEIRNQLIRNRLSFH